MYLPKLLLRTNVPVTALYYVLAVTAQLPLLSVCVYVVLELDLKSTP
jgi:hypothetical protein